MGHQYKKRQKNYKLILAEIIETQNEKSKKAQHRRHNLVLIALYLGHKDKIPKEERKRAWTC